jgi:hypothetical protein
VTGDLQDHFIGRAGIALQPRRLSRNRPAVPIIVRANQGGAMMPGEPPDESGEDEVTMVLKALRELRDKVSSPVVRACLESACEDIAHLVGTGEDAGQQP